jgi:DNA-nicking Smr family endonuclease
MSKSGHKPRRGTRTVTEDEAQLWKYATRTLEPVKVKPRVATRSAFEAELPPAGAPEPPPPAPVRSRKAELAPKNAPVAPAPPKPRRPPPLADFDRRKARQVASGKVEVDARIDLHGLTQSDARAALRGFLLSAYGKGQRLVLVITGKGGADARADGLGSLLGERQRGVIKRNVPHWLEEPDLRSVVLSYTEAGARHGGSGALYVRLRKASRSD